MLTRRHLLSLLPAGLVAPSGLVLPRPLARLDGATDRKFLFIYCYGGWDPLMVFAPKFDTPNIDMQEGCVAAEANGIAFADHEDRPSVRQFFEDYGDRACVINGMEVRSITHERCQRMLFTGGGDAVADDWAVISASNTRNTYPTPHLVFSGPAFAAEYAANVVRAGEVGQLTELIGADALSRSTLPVSAPSASAEALEDAFVQERLAAFSGSAPRGSPRTFGARYTAAVDNLASLRAVGDAVDLDPAASGCRRDIAKDGACMLNAFEVGLARTAITRDSGWCSVSWDTHSDNDTIQGRSFEELFGYLNEIMVDLDGRVGQSGNPLRDEVTIVVFSEMGRHPQLTGGGRAHWTFTSAMLIGSGIRGGQVIGRINDNYEGEAVDVATGQVSESGEGLLPGHIGATLLELAGVDYTKYVTQGQPITAAMDT